MSAQLGLSEHIQSPNCIMSHNGKKRRNTQCWRKHECHLPLQSWFYNRTSSKCVGWEFSAYRKVNLSVVRDFDGPVKLSGPLPFPAVSSFPREHTLLPVIT